MMAQRIGKVSLLLFVVNVWCVQPHVSLHITDAQGYETQTVGVGVPFLITVEVSGGASGASSPDLSVYPPIDLQGVGTSSSIRTVNGRTSEKKQYRYQGRVDREGSYTIGPARIQKDGQEFVSESITLEVSHAQDVSESQEAAFLKIETSKKEVFIGEKVPFTLRFYYANNDVRIEGIENPAFDGFKATKLKGPQTGKETINGTVYRYQEWSCTLYPKQIGELVIPAINAQVSVAMQNVRGASDLLSLMNNMLGGHAQLQSMYSNSLPLTVKPLPHNDSSTKAVGHFTGFTAKVNLDKAAEGEGVVYTLELIGDGNFSMINHPYLQLPEGLKFYESNTHFTPLAANTYKKDFEYVIQGIEPGSYTIEPQEFTYFDTTLKTYKTLRSKPVNITITPGTSAQTSLPEDEHKDNAVVHNNELEDALYVTKWRFKMPRSLAWLWFFLAALAPVIFAFGCFVRRKWSEYQEKYAPHYGYKNAFKDAKYKVEQCKKNGSVAQLYTICIDLFAARLKLPSSEISETRIERALEQRGMKREQREAWQDFFTDITAASFASADSASREHLCVLLLEWIKKFERVL